MLGSPDEPSVCRRQLLVLLQHSLLLLCECSKVGHRYDSVFSLKSSWNSPLKHGPLIKEQFAHTHTHTCKQQPFVRRGGGIEGSDFRSVHFPL